MLNLFKIGNLANQKIFDTLCFDPVGQLETGRVDSTRPYTE